MREHPHSLQFLWGEKRKKSTLKLIRVEALAHIWDPYTLKKKTCSNDKWGRLNYQNNSSQWYFYKIVTSRISQPIWRGQRSPDTP